MRYATLHKGLLKKSTLALAAAGFAGSLFATAPATAGNIPILSGGAFNMQGITSLKEARFRKVIKQQYDFSCGSAALATLLSYHYDTPRTEEDVFVSMFENGDEEKIQTEGFSLLDMKGYLERQGIRADGYRADLDRLEAVGIPAIVLITTRGYRHFVVIKGISRSEVLVGDPALGARTYERAEFEKIWNGILFVVTDRMDVAKRNFNQAEEWHVRSKAPFGTALTRQGLATFTMTLPGPNDF